MSNLSEQVKHLIETGPQQDIPPAAIAAIAQMLATVAKDLDHLRYFALRDRQQGWWLISTGGNSTNEGAANEQWVAAFGHLADAERMLSELAKVGEGTDAPAFEVVEKETIELLFLALGLQRSAGLLLYESEGDADKIARGLPISGKGIRKDDLKAEMKRCLGQLQRSSQNIA